MTLNTALWLAPVGLGLSLPRVVIASLFGRSMVRADITVSKGCPAACVEWRADRGNVVSNVAGLLTVHELDGKVQAISVSSSTKVTDSNGNSYSIGAVKPGWRVLVIWPALGGSADSVKIEKRGNTGS